MYRNDPYYPRPGQDDWNDIKHKFLEASQQILKGGPPSHLPSLWVDPVEYRAVVGSYDTEKPEERDHDYYFGWLTGE